MDSYFSILCTLCNTLQRSDPTSISYYIYLLDKKKVVHMRTDYVTSLEFSLLPLFFYLIYIYFPFLIPLLQFSTLFCISFKTISFPRSNFEWSSKLFYVSTLGKWYYLHTWKGIPSLQYFCNIFHEAHRGYKSLSEVNKNLSYRQLCSNILQNSTSLP